jgi:hypothetical protein
MPGSIPGIPGLIAFAGVKFGGYCLAGMTLRKLQPAITASAIKIAGARTGLGMLIGIPLSIGMTFVLSFLFPAANGAATISAVTFIFAMRVLVWALVIHLFTKRIVLPKSKFWGYSALGALWSCLLDVPGIGMALITPGQIPFC